jgi:thiol-disulfide isomerase/thioredoxin
MSRVKPGLFRCYFLCALLFFLAACPEKEENHSQYSRVAAVNQPAHPADTKWCDAYFAPAEGPVLELPSLATPTAQTLPAGKWVWLNLWATWCKPCIREMPTILLWRDQLVKGGSLTEVVFLSLDEDTEELAKFLDAHAELKAAARMRASDPGNLASWFAKYKLPADSAIPVHLLVAPDGRVRCARAGALADGDFATVKNLMK